MLNSDDGFLNAYKNETNLSQGFSWVTFLELLQARVATAKYLDFDKAMKDGYEDINVVVPNMGYHFMKSKFVNATFDVSKPEILVYNKRLDGRFVLVAVEYAVPISVTPDIAPEGFTGSADVWERNTDFGLWLLNMPGSGASILTAFFMIPIPWYMCINNSDNAMLAGTGNDDA